MTSSADNHSAMNASDLKKLEALRSDYASVVGSSFKTFYCPILFRDDDVELCRAHLVNQAFAGVSRRWTIQVRRMSMVSLAHSSKANS